MDYKNPVEDKVLRDYKALRNYLESNLAKTHPIFRQVRPIPEDITIYKWINDICKNGHEIRIEKSKYMVRLKNKNTGDVFIGPNPIG